MSSMETSHTIKKSAVCLICLYPDKKEKYLQFLSTFEYYDIYLVVDDNIQSYANLQKEYPSIRFVQFRNDLCEKSGYKNLSNITLNKAVTGWDKAIYLFTLLGDMYSHVWFLEDDVYFHSENTLVNMDNKYLTEDILCNSSYEPAKLNEWLWSRIQIPFQGDYSCGMMCALRLSSRYLESIRDYVAEYGTLFFLEAFFTSFAQKMGFKILPNPPEFLTITYNRTFMDEELDDKRLFHPMKNLDDHVRYRENKESI